VTYNQGNLLRNFLDNYLKHGAQLLDLTVVDDGSDDSTLDILNALPKTLDIHIHHLPHGSIAKSRNHALRNSPTPWLAFSDTDCELSRRYFESLVSLPDRFAGFAAVEGAVFSPPGPKPPFTHSLANPKGGTYATANMVFHVSTILALGGFDEDFKNFREDSDLALTILARSGPIPFYPELAVVHPHLPRSLGHSLRRAMASQALIIRSEIRLFEKHPENYGLLRHHRHVRATLRAWVLKYSAACIKEGLQFIMWSPDLTPRQRLQSLKPASAAVVVALWEQICVAALCMLQLPKLVRLKTK
jgi:glycosyltransferase involved in cell wall biosynthesis